MVVIILQGISANSILSEILLLVRFFKAHVQRNISKYILISVIHRVEASNDFYDGDKDNDKDTEGLTDAQTTAATELNTSIAATTPTVTTWHSLSHHN